MRLADARAMAKELMAQHLDGQKPGWVFYFDNGRRRFGCCHYNQRRISLSKYLVMLNDESQVRDTILHEIAHALAGPRDGHNKTWRKLAHSIGCNGSTYYDSSVVTQPPKPYTGTCPNCGKQSQGYRRRNVACSNCCNLYNNGKYSERYKLVWTSSK